MVKNKDMFVAIDGNAIVHRAFHAYPPTLTTSSGLAVNAAYGFTVMLLQVLKQFEPKYIVCAFDTGKPTFRHTQFPEYKAHRKPTDQSLIDQFPVVEQILTSLNIPILKKDGYEADDILGTISAWSDSGKWKSYDLDMRLVTGDRDFLQLISGSTKVCIPQGSFNSLTTFDRELAYEKYGYFPEQVVQYKGLVGDASDNIPGIKGVGEKSTKDLFNKYGSLEEIYKHLDELKPRVANLLREGWEQAQFSMELATIKRDVDISLQLENCVLKDFDEKKVIELFNQLEFRSLIPRLPKSLNQESVGGQFDMFSNGGTNESVDHSKDLAGISNLRVVGYIDNEESATGVPFLIGAVVDKEGKLSTSIIDSFTKSSEHETWFYNLEEYVAQNESNIADFEGVFDVKMLTHSLTSGKKKYDISTIAFEYLSKNIPEKIGSDDLDRVGSTMLLICQEAKKRISKTSLNEYVSKWEVKLQERFDNNSVGIHELVHNNIDVPLAFEIAKMERRGILIDFDKLNVLSDEVKGEISNISGQIYEDIGHEFNINSPKQLSDILFVELGLPSNYKKSTREEILSELIGLHPVIEKILKYRELSKLLNTYVLPFLETKLVDGQRSVHSDFKMTGSSSGRFASVNPNMQNIPSRGIWAGRIREAFVAREGFELVGADYSQIEFRVMADVSNDAVLVDDFNKGKDIHTLTASRILGKGESEVSKEDRNLGKTINFAILFGQTPFGLSKLANIPSALAKEYIEQYFKTYSGVAKYIENAKEIALKYGYAQSMFGRTRYISGLASKNRMVQSGAIREAVNMPIQGGEADIMRLAMVEIGKMIDQKYNGDAYMLLQIHDELIFEVKREKVSMFKDDVSKIMRDVVTLNVPLEVHVSNGTNMSELK